MIKYLIKNPNKWRELELYRFIHAFNYSFDALVFEYLNNPTSEIAFIRSLKPVEREIYDRLEVDTYNDDNELLEAVYLFAENVMREKTSTLLRDKLTEINNVDIFETLEAINTESDNILKSSKIDAVNYFDEWQKELLRKAAGDITIIESQIVKDVPFLAGELSIVAARPSMGKTALALSLLLEKCKDFKVLFISSEMPVKRIIDRLVSYDTQIATRRITTGRLTEIEIQQVIESKNRLEENESIILDYCESIRKAKRVISNSDAQLVIVDYLQLLKSDIKAERRLQVAEMSRDFKRIAVNKDVAVILLAQINRETVKSETKRPSLANLAESAAIEQDADNVIFIHRPPYYAPPEVQNSMSAEELAETELVIAKQRDGLRGIKKCMFIKGRFYPEDTYVEDDKEDDKDIFEAEVYDTTIENDRIDDFVPF